MSSRKRVPSYRLHKPSGQARVIIDGKHHYLGPFGSQASREKYARLISEHPTASDREDHRPFPVHDGTIDQLLLRYLEFAKTYYVKDGEPTRELESMKAAMGHIRVLYSQLPVQEFGPVKLKVVRQHMVDGGLSRGVINNRIGRIKRIFKWAVADELIPPATYEALRAVPGLKYGRTEARETEPVQPVDDEIVDRTIPFLSPQVAAMVQLQRLTGMRPGEVVIMRMSDIDRSQQVWIYEVQDHKSRWRGHRRIVPLGPVSQSLIEPFLNRPEDSYLFSPIESEDWRLQHRPCSEKGERKTPVYPSELRRREREKLERRQRKHKSKRPKRESYNTASYRRSVTYGIKKGNRVLAREGVEERIPHWFPNQLRHRYGTDVRRDHGVEAAQIGLGHARTDVVEVYAEKNLELAIEIAKGR